MTHDFDAATTALAQVVRGVRDDQLDGPTPCPAYTVADLLDHVDGLAAAFTAAARKESPAGGSGPVVDGTRLGDRWRERITRGLAELAEAWRRPGAYDGDTWAGPVWMSAPEAALVALDEVVVHGWDLARATGQPYDPDPRSVLTCLEFARVFELPPGVEEGPFGPPVAVPSDAPALDQLAGATGRQPGWRPPVGGC